LTITNRTKGCILAEKAGIADTLASRMKGLLGRKGLDPGEALVIIPCISIHTVGMRFPIDAVFFGRDNKAVATLRHMKPYRLSGLYTSARGVIELPAGTLDRSPVDVGDLIDMT
jgi:hypothetical protein